MKKIKAVDKHIIVRPFEGKGDITKEGIIIPRGEKSSKLLAYGEVVSIGPNHDVKESGLKENDKIIYQWFKRDRFLVGDEYLEPVRIDQVLASYED